MNKQHTADRSVEQSVLPLRTLDAVFDGINGGIIIFNVDNNFRIHFISKNCLQMLGYHEDGQRKQAAKNMSFFDFAKDPHIALRIRHQLEECGRVNCAFEVYKRDGSLIWVLLQGKAEIQPDGISRLCSTMIDITESKKTEQLSPLTSLCYKSVLEQLGYLIFEYSMTSRKIIFSQATAEKYGLPSVINSDLSFFVQNRLIDPKSLHDVKQMLHEMDTGKGISQGTLRLGCGKNHALWCECTMIASDKNTAGTNSVLGIVKNITRQREREIRQTKERRFHEVILSSVLKIYKINLTEDFIVEGNEDWDKRFGIKPESCYSDMLTEFVEKSVYPDDIELVRKAFGRDNLIRAFKDGQTILNLEFRRAELNKPYVWIKCTIGHLLDPETMDLMSVFTIKNIDSRKQREAEMLYLAERDSLCKLYNHGTTKLRITEFLKCEEGRNNQHALLVLDIDNFKQINDLYGHLNGDTLLAKIAESLHYIFRSTDILGRLGGDEFILFLKNISNPEKAIAKAAEVNQTIQALELPCKPGLSISVSIGIALCPSDGTSFEELYFNADTALYQAKRSGKNKFVLYNRT